MRFIVYFLGLAIIVLAGCQQAEQPIDGDLFADSPSIMGKAAYLPSPYVTAGNRVYMVGHQDGSFPELGWHIQGEMGGIWNHPIKLMDGFDVNLNWGTESYVLDKARSFINYPFANRHEFSIEEKSLSIVRTQFVPDNLEGVSVQFKVKNQGDKPQNFTFDFTGHTDLSPTWLAERLSLVDYQDVAQFDQNRGAWSVRDSINPWFVKYGADITPDAVDNAPYHYKGNGTSNTLSYAFNLDANETKEITFIIAGSYISSENAQATYDQIKSKTNTLLKEKKQRYQQIAEMSKLTIPDKQLQETFEWLKYNSDWLVRTVPEIGTGIGAGIPDYPWWFGVDSEYALQGYMAIGQQETVYNTIRLLDSISQATNGNGRIVHEVSTNGVVFNPGNINETPQFASLIWNIYQWNGDKAFLDKYFPTIVDGMTWLMNEKDANQNLFPDGFGMMEIHGLNSEMIDVAVYTQKAFDDASKMADILGKNNLATQYAKTAEQLKEKINNEFWSEEFSSYADFIGTDEQALHLIEDAIVRADTLNKPWAVKELEDTRQAILNNPSPTPRPFVLHHNWVVNTPMEMGIADEEKAKKALKTAESFVNPFGVFVTGIDRDESAGTDDGSFKGSKIFSYTGAVMTLPTGVQAIAENNYGNPGQALNYLQRMSRTFSYALPGSMYEVSPDYGMMTQAWNIYSFAVPIIHQFFGIQPNAANKEVLIKPQMPQDWDNASLENVIIEDNAISVFYLKNENETAISIKQIRTDWSVVVELPKSPEGFSWDVEGNGNQVDIAPDGSIRLRTQEADTEIRMKRE